MADYHTFPAAPEGTPEANFVHLHVHSDYSLLDSCASIDKLVAKAKSLNMKALALTDHGNMFGALNFEKLCHVNGINPIVGSEFYITENHNVDKPTRYGSKYFHLILLCKNQKGYENMSWLSSNSFTDKNSLYYGKPRIDFEMLKERHEGIICLSACIAGELPQILLNDKNADAEAEAFVKKYSELFGKDHFYIELQDHGLKDQKIVNPKLIALAKKMNIPLVVTNDIHYVEKEDAEAQDALRCIGFKKILTEPHQTMGDGLSEWYFKTEEEMRSLFPDLPEAYENTVKIANMCDLTIHQYSTPELKSCLPRFELPLEFRTHGDDYEKNQNDFVRHIVEKGLRDRYGEITPEIRARAEYELGIIFKMGFSGYFLIVWEFINWAKEHKKPIGPGRGSGAGSLVAYAMTITDIDPFRFKLIFERFLNPERVSMPDFDVDMDFDFRQDIIEHTRTLYGEPQVGHIVTFGTLKAKQVIADVGRVLGIPLSEVNMLKSKVSENLKATLKNCFEPANEKFPDGGQLAEFRHDPRYERLFNIAEKLEGCKRNTGLHASGMVIGLTALPNWAPVFKDAKTGEVAVQYTMDIIEPCGLVKFDYLGLKTLSLIRYAEEIINRHKKPSEPEFDCSKVSETDKKTFELFCRGDSVAVFQFESPGMQKILRQFQPEKLEDLVALNALYRPGPMDYIPNYIDGKWKPETVHYPDPCLEDILKETYGVMVYQEQVMQVSQKIAGFSLGGADMLRRAMGKKKPEVLMGKKIEFEEGAVKQGFSKEHADEIFEIMIPFAGYGFNKSHAAAYSVLAYRTGYLKANHPAEFMAANLTNEISTTDGLPKYIAEARRMGIAVDPPDVNRSAVRFDVINGRIVFGLLGIKGLGELAANEIVLEREKGGAFKTFMDFLLRMMEHADSSGKRAITKKAVEVLIKSGAFDSLDKNRPTMLESLESAFDYAENVVSGTGEGQIDLFGGTDEKTFVEYEFLEKDDISKIEKLNMEKELIGIFLSGHPLDDYKKAIENATLSSQTIERLTKAEKAEKKRLKDSGAGWEVMKGFGKTHIAVGLLSELKEFTTKTGKVMAFGKLRDYNGEFDLTFFERTWQAVKGTLKIEQVYAFKGKLDSNLERESKSLIVDEVIPPEKVEEKATKELHVLINAPKSSDDHDFFSLKDFLYGNRGPLAVFFHVDEGKSSYTIRASSQMTAPATKEFLAKLKSEPIVREVWTA